MASRLKKYIKRKDAVVVGIPRGGVVVANVVANSLSLPLAVISVKKLASPTNPELAIGAICASGVSFIDWDLALRIGVEQKYLDDQIREKLLQAQERERLYGIKRLALEKKGFTDLILVDDGIATGATVLVAVKELKEQKSSGKTKQNVILAVPVIAKEVFGLLQQSFDTIVALEIDEHLGAVGQYYREFSQVNDEEVANILKEHKT